jgi:integrin-linked kinase-associated serine/threonine phosphatase 2C
MVIDAAAFSEQGPRWSMEDTHVLQVEADVVRAAVFDGHLSSEVSALAAGLYPTFGDGSPGQALLAIHEASVGLEGGACAVALHLAGDHLRVANVGDAELAIVHRRTVRVVTECHRLSNPGERERVLAAGARLDGPYVVNPRTGNGVMPTRGLGDHEFEEVGVVCDPHEWEGRFGAGWLVAACDGLWDVLQPSELPPFLSGSAREVAERLGREALQVRGSWDNLTIIVIHRYDL